MDSDLSSSRYKAPEEPARTGDWLRIRSTELGLALRITVASLLTYVLGEVLRVPQSYWAVLTAVIVLQSSVGGSLKATIDRLVGTACGAIWGVVAAFLVAPTSPVSFGLALALAVAPLALVVGFWPDYRVAPVTAIIVLLGSASHPAGVILAAEHRVAAIALGCAVAVLVAVFVMPARAHELLRAGAADALKLLAEQAHAIAAGMTTGLDEEALLRIQAGTRAALLQVEILASQAERERAHRVTDAGDPEQFVRTLRRLRSDLNMLSRAVAEPLPEPVRAALVPAASRALEESADFLLAAAGSLARHRPAPPSGVVDEALDGFALAMEEVRREGLTRDLPGESVGRVFGLAFGLEQLRQDLLDLAGSPSEQA